MINNNKKVSLLLATYNSERYLREQLDSLCNQSFSDWNLYIRDDGSTDNTLQIIEAYSQNDSRFSLLKDGLKNLGAAMSFMELLKNVESDYYFFCDHDDVWLTDKLMISLQKLQQEEAVNKDKALIVHSDLYVVDQNLQVVNNSFWKSSGIKPSILKNKNFVQVFNFVTGCTMGFNKKARDISLDFPENIPMHDWWITINVLRNGGQVIDIKEPLIYYRQHMSNEVGARNVDSHYFLNKIRNIRVTLHGHTTNLEFLKSINGLGYFRYYFIKIFYSIIRKV